ncbi:hypothetical protein ACN2C0_10325 [Aliarcobacter butzleri]|uniref:hypothetical protein n=1 Tax=Aliarcobacter butzleri TaxID=28197 RepID=UPI00189EE46E|nr:hypothetical protein [Aliarcobacter butzleri]MBF7065430.1 hypothetical protein [Aliarcobacter butzleri]
MTHRVPVRCNTCDKGIVFRIGVGGEDIQYFSIACPKCKQKIGLKLILDSNPIPFGPSLHYGGKIDEYINCIESEESNDFIAINIHAELVYPAKYIHEKVFIPSTEVMKQMYRHGVEKGIIDENKIQSQMRLNSGTNFLSIFDILSGDAKLSKDWIIIKKSLELQNNGFSDLVEKELKKYSNLNSLPSNGKYLENIVFDFFYRFISPNKKLYSDIEDEFEKARKLNNNEFENLIHYYKTDLKKLHIKNYIEIFNEYFTNYKDFNRILLNNKILLHPEEKSECIICPIDFEKVKMYYGNAYEFFTTHILTIVCANNILMKRKFNEFETMTFPKYLKDVSKESKSKPVENNASFKKFTDILDSNIRNASHHKWFYTDEKNAGRLNYRSGGTGALKEISYLNYLYKCNEITMHLAVLFMIEIYLIDYN